MIKFLWIALHAVSVTAVSLIAAVATHNPNWPLNIPLGLAVGTVWGWLSWKLIKNIPTE